MARARKHDSDNTGNKGTGDFTNDANDSNDISDRDGVASRASTENERPRSMGDIWEERGVDRDLSRGFGDIRGKDADRTDVPDPIDPTGAEWENGPGVDVDDPNLSQVMAEAGAEDRREELGKLDENGDPDEMELEDPDAEAEEEAFP